MTDAERQRVIRNNHELVKDCQPAAVFSFFADLAAIPRQSGNVAGVADFLEDFARRRHLEHIRDAVGNVIIRKPAQRHQAEKGVILQAHQDMVCVRGSGVTHDFAKDPIEFVRDGDRLTARGTTLGADDGIGVALALAVLDDPHLAHPPLEALFTVDEETDMKGAKNVSETHLQGGTLINLDAEELGIAYVSSAAGISSLLELPLAAAPEGGGPVFRKILANGLRGGHSGLEIHQARANAYVLLARFLSAAAAETAYFFHTLDQGEGRGADNAIPDRATAVVSLRNEEDAATLERLAATWSERFRHEFHASDPGVRLEVEADGQAENSPAIAGADRDTLLRLIRLLPLGVFRFLQTGDLPTRPYGQLLVETSCNLGIVCASVGKGVLTLLARGSTPSVLEDLQERISALAALAGGSIRVVNRTQGWEMPERPTPVQELFLAQGLRSLGVHAGLECGCLVSTLARAGRALDAVSVGPDITGAHSPQECLGIASVQTLWNQVLAVLSTLR